MLIYSVSCTVKAESVEAWQTFFLEKHLDDVVNTGCFTKYTFRKKLSDDSEDVTFISEYYYEEPDNFERYKVYFAAGLKAEVGEKFAGQYECQRAFYEVISLL